jgi:hypothetical protein
VASELAEGQTAWIGTETGTWPVEFFTTEDQAISWLMLKPSEITWVKRVWRVKLTDVIELELGTAIETVSQSDRSR